MEKILRRIILLTALAVGLSGTVLAKRAEPLHVDAALDRPVVPADRDENVVVQIKIKPERILTDRERPPVNLSLVLDRSGSMGGEKIRDAVEAAIVAIGKLGPRDLVSVIIYNHDVETLAGSQYATEEQVASIRRALLDVRANGNTAIYAGLNQAAAELRRRAGAGYINRMVLLSDGLANEGPSKVRDFRSLARAFAGEDIVVSTVGLGLDYHEDIMTTLADAGQGNTYFCEDPRDLSRIFGAELGDALNVAATDIEIIVRPREGVRILRSIGREADMDGAAARFSLPQAYGGLDKLALVEVQVPRGAAGDARDLIDVVVNYKPAGEETVRQQSVTVPIAYTERLEEVRERARVDVAQNVISNEIAEARDEAIAHSDQGDRERAAEELKKSSEQLRRQYGFLGDAVVAEPAAYLDQEAGEVAAEGVPNAKRKAFRAGNAQVVNQQSYQQSE